MKVKMDSIAKFLHKNDITDYDIGEDGYYYVYGGVYITEFDDGNFPIKFGKVDGYFDCDGINVTTLENFPYYISDDLYCWNTNIKTRFEIYKISVSGTIFSNCLWKF